MSSEDRMQYVLGVDGGNTKTIALLAALDGAILGAGRGGCGDIYNAYAGSTWPDSAAAAVANIEYAVVSALQAAHVAPGDIATAVFNMAGADWPEDFSYLRAAMEARGFGRAIFIQNDAMGVLHAGAADDIGVSVICGTGAATGACGPDGRTWHSSRWQDQTQGGEHLSRKALEAVYRAELGMESPTTLRGRMLAFFDMHSVEEILHHLTARRKHEQVSADGLAPLLLDEAQEGDSVALAVVREHGEALGNYALAAARKVGLEGRTFALVLAGGVFRHPSTLLEEIISARVLTTCPGVRTTRSRFEPIIGVLCTALEATGVKINEELLARLVPTIPEASLFATNLYSTSL
jgi:N-acetylglucosamine kinase-like BadF-type ATPase